MNITYEQISELIKLSSSKDWIDYISAIAGIFTSLFFVFFGYYTFIQAPKQLVKSKVNEKEVEMLYKAFEHLFIFSDAVGLYISNKERKYKKLSSNSVVELESSFAEKDRESSEGVYASFRDYNMAASIFRSIGATKIKDDIDMLKTKVVEFRNFIYDIENVAAKQSKEEYEELSENILKKRNEIDKIKNNCFDGIRDYKNKLKK
ncbi:hypothetical protein [Budvicia diplopodorum]|uniref:hypothetical protein n=1 Tax=Budvicia diplopodorum TaxID=1119056 RepID=UPI001358DE39|nr:hypothetical protein [Budvicia diplopodorum]